MKDYKKIFTVALLSTLLVFSNIVLAKTVSFFGFPMLGSILAYPLTFLCIALLNEWYGEKTAIEGLFLSIVIQIIVIYLAVMTIQLPSLDCASGALQNVLLGNIALLGGGLVSYTAAQYVNIKLYNYAKKYLPKLLSIIASLLVALIVDATMFIGIFMYNSGNLTDNLINIGTQITGFILMMIFMVPVFLGFTKKDKE